MERAETLVREMEEAGIDASIGIYHTMMDGYTMIGNEDKCLVVFARLKVNTRNNVAFVQGLFIQMCTRTQRQKHIYHI